MYRYTLQKKNSNFRNLLYLWLLSQSIDFPMVIFSSCSLGFLRLSRANILRVAQYFIDMRVRTGTLRTVDLSLAVARRCFLFDQQVTLY